MKFYTTTYHYNLIKDKDRLATFFEGIKRINNEYINFKELKLKIRNTSLALDLGCGSGVLSYFASKYFDFVLAMDIDGKIIDCAKKSFYEAKIENVYFINEDASLFNFSKFSEYLSSLKWPDYLNYLDCPDFQNLLETFDFSKDLEYFDLIICEMLDTALIDEEEVPVLNNIQKYLKKDTNVKILPKGIINIVEPVYMERDYIHYEDEEHHGNKPKYQILGDPVKYLEIDFLDDINPKVEKIIDFNYYNNYNNFNKNINSQFKVNGLKITTFTLITENIICGPSQMLNPPIFVPISSRNNKLNFETSIKLEYIMGGGVENVKANFIHRISD